MNVQELIDKLEKVEDKTIAVCSPEDRWPDQEINKTEIKVYKNKNNGKITENTLFIISFNLRMWLDAK